MFSRILFSTMAAATLLAATPALATESTKGNTKPTSSTERTSNLPCSSCSDGSMHDSDLRAREEAAKKMTECPPTPRADSDDPYIRNQSFGG